MYPTDEARRLLETAVDYVNVYEPVDIRTYSGRGMYGDECLAIDGDFNDCIKVLFKACVFNPEAFERLELESFSSDSMGLGVVFYWTHLDTDGMEFDEDD